MKTLVTTAHEPIAAMLLHLMPYINAVIAARWILIIADDAHIDQQEGGSIGSPGSRQ